MIGKRDVVPFVSKKATAALITDSISNLQRVETLLQQIDRPVTAGMKPKFYQLTNAKASDLVNKLGKRGYVLTGQSAVETKNGREGTRFDFDYTIPGTDEPKFYSVSLFVTDKYKFVVQVAGDKQFATTLARGIELLRCFTADATELSNADLAQRSGLPRPTVSRLTYTLTVLGYLRHTQNYIHLAARGLTLFDVAPARVERDLEQWQGICRWLDQ